MGVRRIVGGYQVLLEVRVQVRIEPQYPMVARNVSCSLPEEEDRLPLGVNLKQAVVLRIVSRIGGQAELP